MGPYIPWSASTDVPELVDVTLKVKRYNPEKDTKPHWQEFKVQVEETDRVLDALHKATWEHDGTLTFRRSCAHGVCGSDAMVINGANAPGLHRADQGRRPQDHRSRPSAACR